MALPGARDVLVVDNGCVDCNLDGVLRVARTSCKSQELFRCIAASGCFEHSRNHVAAGRGAGRGNAGVDS